MKKFMVQADTVNGIYLIESDEFDSDCQILESGDFIDTIGIEFLGSIGTVVNLEELEFLMDCYGVHYYPGSRIATIEGVL